MLPPIKKVIFLEMAVLSVLLVIAVLISSKLDKPKRPQDHVIAGNTTVNTEETAQTEALQTGPTWNTYPEDRQITARQYFVYDCLARTYLVNSGSEDDRVYPACITKLFTAYVAMYYLHPDAYIEIGDAVDMVVPDSPVANLQKGDRLTARQLLEGMLLSNGDDAAYVLACETGRIISGKADLDEASAVEAFMTEMNRRAKALGMTNSHFTNPIGIHDPEHYSTVKDLTNLATLCMEDNTIMRNAVVPEADIELHNEIVVWKNTNPLINPDSPYYCPYAIGLKTGQTPDAGNCLLSAFKKDGQFLVIGVFGCPEETDRYDDALQLFNQVVLD